MTGALAGRLSIGLIITLLLLITAVYFLLLSVYYVSNAMPATGLTALLSGITLLLASLYVYGLEKGLEEDEEE